MCERNVGNAYDQWDTRGTDAQRCMFMCGIAIWFLEFILFMASISEYNYQCMMITNLSEEDCNTAFIFTVACFVFACISVRLPRLQNRKLLAAKLSVLTSIMTVVMKAIIRMTIVNKYIEYWWTAHGVFSVGMFIGMLFGLIVLAGCIYLCCRGIYKDNGQWQFVYYSKGAFFIAPLLLCIYGIIPYLDRSVSLNFSFVLSLQFMFRFPVSLTLSIISLLIVLYDIGSAIKRLDCMGNIQNETRLGIV